ncbi:hypothetical protein WEN_02540 [Mycoplasma wenyonii str. Massachusetts]|uniref:Uncharacterized protein n=1 Tax=Mycoplasma wenyonii (strain Massachusetts) TaxID=1197325 RepID=I6Z6T9_MYCWM|nr:hypothetical protein [Mycoplasma wenyonii]AFN65293.1 hypothetical protein WEN_02540 [Mycoplasma wenyonii str. Massachusetts]
MLSGLLGISPNLLRKILIVASSGGSPVFYFGSPKIFNFGANRKIKWTLKDNGEGKKTEDSIEQKGGKWTSKEKKWQGLELSSWNKVEDGGAKTIYKLMIKKEWTREESSFLGNNSVKGGLGLFKVSLKKTGGRDISQVTLEEISAEEAKAVWLIVAKSQKSTYLIPAVRKLWGNLGRWQRSDNSCWEGVNGVWRDGIGDLKNWKDSGKLGDGEIKELTERLKDGFVIARGGKGYGGRFGWGGNGGRSSTIDSFVQKKNGRKQGDVVIYKNAGILAEKNNRGKVCAQEDKSVRYFPLEIKELGGTILKELKDRSQATWSEVKVSEKIEEVGIYKWEEVMFNETGVGIKKGSELKWGTVNRLTWVPELLK